MAPTLASGWWFTSAWEQGPVYAVSWLFWIVASIVLHELAHGFTAIRCGDRTPIETGHMTWNPVVHMGQMGLFMLAAAGVSWGFMPVNPRRFRRRYDDALVSLAGPATNLCLVLITVVLHAVWVSLALGRVADHVFENVHAFLVIGGMINLVLFVLNLLPLPPLDGSRILGTFIPAFRQWAQSDQGRMVGLMLFLPIFFFGGEYVYPAAVRVFSEMSMALRSSVGR